MWNPLAGKIEEGKVHIFFGKMGSGKTSNAVHQMLLWHKELRPVWCNFPLTTIAPVTHAPFWFEDDPAGIRSMRDGLFVIDEAYLTMNSREWQKLDPKTFTAFTHVRKLHMTVIVIAQSWLRIDKSIRELATTAREFRGGSFFGRFYSFVDWEVDEAGDIVKEVREIEENDSRKGFSVFGKRVYDSYDTDSLFSVEPPTKKWASAVTIPPRGSSSPTAQNPEAQLIQPRAPWNTRLLAGVGAWFRPQGGLEDSESPGQQSD